VQRIDRTDIEALLHIKHSELDTLQGQGLVSLAFGSPVPSEAGKYFDMDCASLAINFALSAYIGRPTATAIVLQFGALIAAIIARAEADKKTEFYIGVAALGVRDAARKIPAIYGISGGTLPELREDFQGHKLPLMNACLANISDILRRLRFNAGELGINFPSEIFFLPTDPRFSEIQTAVEREIKGRVARLKTDSKKFRRTKDQIRRRDIEYLARSTIPSYPLEMVSI